MVKIVFKKIRTLIIVSILPFLILCLEGQRAGRVFRPNRWGPVRQGDAVTNGESATGDVKVKILAINDFHGHLGTGKKVKGRNVGSAPVLASYLKEARRGWEDNSLVVHVGDLWGRRQRIRRCCRTNRALCSLTCYHTGLVRNPEKNDPDCDLVAKPWETMNLTKVSWK